ncbi:response regulator [Chitinophaga oryzae]
MYKIAGKHLIIKEFNTSTLALIQIRDFPPDIVLTNLIMPQPDGIEFIKLIREFNKQIPIVVVSARFNPKILRDVRNAGANSFFFKKDMNLNILSAKIDILTSGRNHAAAR